MILFFFSSTHLYKRPTQHKMYLMGSLNPKKGLYMKKKKIPESGKHHDKTQALTKIEHFNQTIGQVKETR